MNTRMIDKAKCIGCGKCIKDCINQYLILTEDETGKRKAGFKERGRCLECGHCNAICPQGAITGGKAIFEIDGSDKVLNVMSMKRSVRSYIKGVAISKDIMDKIVLAGHSAPTDRNRKSARIIFIKESLPKVYNLALDYLVSEVKKTGTINPLYVPTMALDSKRDEVLWNAEYLVILVGLPSSMIDASIASERMQIVASQYNVGSAYRGDMKNAINNCAELREMLQIKSNEEVLVSFAMGLTNLKYNIPAIKENRKVCFV
jgi:ferredoxin